MLYSNCQYQAAKKNNHKKYNDYYHTFLNDQTNPENGRLVMQWLSKNSFILILLSLKQNYKLKYKIRYIQTFKLGQ